MRKLLLSTALVSTSLFAEPTMVEMPPDLPIETFKVTYNSTRDFNESVKQAFVNITGYDSVGEALELLIDGSYITSAECNVEMCEVSWETTDSGKAGGSIEGTGLVGGVSGSLEGEGSANRKFFAKVPCSMLFETIQRLDTTKKKEKDNN